MRSGRLPGSLEPNPLTLEVAALRRQGRPFLDLTVSNPTRCGFPYPGTAIREALGGSGVLAYDPDPRGAAAARAAVAAWHGRGVDPEEVVLTASTSEAYGWLFKLLCDPGDDVLVPSPSYPLFHWLGALEGVEARPVPALPLDRWELDFDAMARALTPRTRAVIVVNPNNPTGQFLSRSEWDGLLAFCAGRGLALLVDEVFSDYRLEPAADGLPTALETPDPPCPVFVLSGLSKIAALPQVKLGWIVARGAKARDRLEDLAFIADQYLSVSAPASAAAGPILALAPEIQGHLKARLRSNLAALDTALARHPALGRARVEGGWSAVLRVPALEPGEGLALRVLREAEVLLHPGIFFDMPGEGRLVCSLLPEEFPAAVERVAALFPG
jgi:aspartate/methionine/tyrosine aminotransferase